LCVCARVYTCVYACACECVCALCVCVCVREESLGVMGDCK
jgi:hypothetical protein